jgi:hypothetical protein
MATAAEAATAAVEAPATAEAPAVEPATAVTEGEAAPAPAKAGGSELVRMAREKRALERRIAELTKPAAKTDAVTRESLLAELKAKWEDDPDSVMGEIGGEDFVKLAQRLAKRSEAAQTPEKQIEKLTKQLADLQAERDGEKQAKATDTVKAVTAQHVATVAKAIEDAKDANGDARYPTLASLDPEALDEPVAVTAYQAVMRAYQKEHGDKPGGWTEDEQVARFHAAFAGLESHYAKLRSPRPQKPSNPEPEEVSRTISNTHSSGVADPPARRATGTLSVAEAIRQTLKEFGVS